MFELRHVRCGCRPDTALPLTTRALSADRGGVSSAAPTDLTELLFAEIAQQEAYIRACTADHWGAIGEIEQAVAALVDVVQRDHSGVQLVRATHSHQARRKGELCARAGNPNPNPRPLGPLPPILLVVGVRG